MRVMEFVAGDERRGRAEPVAYGDGWTRRTDPNAVYAVRWFPGTGELCALRRVHPAPELASVLERHHVAPSELDEQASVEVVATIEDAGEVDRVLGHWREHMTGDDSFGWVTTRVATRAGH
jgi:hypothetical protein